MNVTTQKARRRYTKEIGMTASQHDLSLPLRIVPQKDTEIVDIVEANGRLVCPCDAYDAQEIVRSVNSFRQMRTALSECVSSLSALRLSNTVTKDKWPNHCNHVIGQALEALALAEKGAL